MYLIDADAKVPTVVNQDQFERSYNSFRPGNATSLDWQQKLSKAASWQLYFRLTGVKVGLLLLRLLPSGARYERQLAEYQMET